MWLTLLALLAPSASAETIEYVDLRAQPIPEAAVVDHYADLFDHNLARRFGRTTMKANPGVGGDPRNLLGTAAAEAAGDWSVWVLRKMPTPALNVPMPQFKKSARSRDQSVAREPSPDRVEAERNAVPSRLALARGPQPRLNFAVTPRLTPPDAENTIETVVQATATGIGPSAWRLSSKPLAKTWSVWMKQDVSRGFALVATADSTAKKPKPAGFSGGTLLRVPGESWRVFARYAHKMPMPKKGMEREHRVALTVSVAPERRKRRKK